MNLVTPASSSRMHTGSSILSHLLLCSIVFTECLSALFSLVMYPADGLTPISLLCHQHKHTVSAYTILTNPQPLTPRLSRWHTSRRNLSKRSALPRVADPTYFVL